MPARKSQKCLKLMIRHQARLIITDKSCDCTKLLDVLSGAIIKISRFINSTSGNYLTRLEDMVSQVNFPDVHRNSAWPDPTSHCHLGLAVSLLRSSPIIF